MYISNQKLLVIVGAAGLVGGGLALAIQTNVAHAQQSGASKAFVVTGQLNALIPEGRLTLTRMEDKETGIVCYVAIPGFLSCVKK